MGVDWQEAYKNWLLFLKNFRLSDLFKLSVLEVISPAILGYVVVAAGLGLSVYLIALIALSIARRSSATRGKIRNNQP